MQQKIWYQAFGYGTVVNAPRSAERQKSAAPRLGLTLFVLSFFFSLKGERFATPAFKCEQKAARPQQTLSRHDSLRFRYFFLIKRGSLFLIITRLVCYLKHHSFTSSRVGSTQGAFQVGCRYEKRTRNSQKNDPCLAGNWIIGSSAPIGLVG